MRSTFTRVTSVALVAGLVGALAFTSNRTPAPVALDDAGVAAILDLANTADIETGALGSKRATNKEVKDFGTMLSSVHTDVRQKARDLVRKLGIKPVLPADNTMGKDHAAAMKKLETIPAADFDRAFLQHEQAYHAAVIKAVTSALLPATQNKELKDFITSLAPAFEAHRAMAEHLQAKVAE